MRIQSPAVKDDLRKRLSRIEGQLRGVQKMVDDERECREIVQQLKAAQSALQNATAVFLRSYAKDCLLQETGQDPAARAALVDDLLDLMSKAP